MSLIEEALKKAQREGEPPRFRPTGGGKAGRGGRRGPKLMIGVIVLLFLVVGGAYFLLRYYEGLPVELIKASSRALSILPQEKAPVLQEVPSPASPSKGEISSSGAAEGGVAFKVEEVSGPEKVKEASVQGEKQKIVPSVSPPESKPKPPLPAGKAATPQKATQPPRRTEAKVEGREAFRPGKGKGRTGGARRKGAKAQSRGDRSIGTLLSEAFRAAERGDLREALGLYSAVLRRDPGNFEALLNRGVVLGKMGDLQGAKRDLEAALEVKPSDAGALNALGVVLMQKGELKEAEDLFERAGDSMAMVNLALLRWRQGRGEEVLGLLERAQELDPHNPYPYYYEGLFLQGMGRKEEAMELFRRAYALARDRGEVGLINRLEALRASP